MSAAVPGSAFDLLTFLFFIFFCTALLLVVFKGRRQKKVMLKHKPSGLVKDGYYGFSWTYLFFGWLVPIFRGEIGIGALHLLLTFATFGFFQLFMAFLFNKQYTTRLLTNGWEICDTEDNARAARLSLGMSS